MWGAISDGLVIQFYQFTASPQFESLDNFGDSLQLKSTRQINLFTTNKENQGITKLFKSLLQIPTFEGEGGHFTLLKYLGRGASAQVFETQTEDKKSAVIKIFFQSNVAEENEKYQIEYNNELQSHQILQIAPPDERKFLSTLIDHSKSHTSPISSASASASASSETKNEPLFLVTSPLGKPFEMTTNKPFTFPGRSCLLHVTKALYQLHKKNIVHFDIKHENMFMKMEGENVVSIFFFNFFFLSVNIFFSPGFFLSE